MQLDASQLSRLRQNAPIFASRFPHAMVLDNHAHPGIAGLHQFELLVAAGARQVLTITGTGAFEALTQFADAQRGQWIFGHLSYDLKNELEELSSSHPDHIGFPLLHFFVPEHLLIVNAQLEVIAGEAFCHSLLKEEGRELPVPAPVRLTPRVSEQEYCDTVNQIRQHIIEGDVYELNYCVEFFNEQAKINPAETFLQLTKKSPTPFSAYYRYQDKHLICASPERFINLHHGVISSQPIKGTVRRSANPEEDQLHREALLHSEKERAENLMIVDLVRNDLARSAKPGSVNVPELFGIYPFRNLYQMISTVQANKRDDAHPVEVIRHAFPMGSMTGAPKIRAMELIEHFENTRRGLYSGAVGYFNPDGDFDFNVVIRSMQYNDSTGYLSVEVGSAITYDSVAESEYAECLLKAGAIREVLSPGEFPTFA